MNAKPLVQHSATRTAPAEIVHLLREVHPDAELVYMEDGRWLLGLVRPGRPGRHAGMDMIDVEMSKAEEDREAYTLKLARLVLQGFASIELFHTNDPDTRIVESFRTREYLHQMREQIVRESMYADETEKQKAREAYARDLATYQAAEAWRWGGGHLTTSGAGLKSRNGTILQGN